MFTFHLLLGHTEGCHKHIQHQQPFSIVSQSSLQPTTAGHGITVSYMHVFIVVLVCILYVLSRLAFLNYKAQTNPYMQK